METASIRTADGIEEQRESRREPFRPGAAQLFAIFALELIAIDIVRRPSDMYFDRFAFFDNGANLTLQYLVSSGLRPAIDFGYHYGLLAVLIGRLWFACLGATPAAYQWAMVTGAILFAWALAKIFGRLGIGAAGLALVIVSLGFAYQSSYPNLAHCLEAVVLAHAMAELARGSYRNALGLATVAVFIKPSMGYVFGAVLLILIVLELRREGGKVRDFIAAVAPSIAIFAVLSIVMIAVYGARSFLFTIVPIEGVGLYRGVHYGFINGPGKYLWDPGERPLALYIVDIPAFWMASTLYLVTAAVAQARGYIRGERLTRAGEVIVTCCILHLAFVFVFFGSGASWIYYSYLLGIGCGLATGMGRGWRLAAVPLCALALLASITPLADVARTWKTRSPYPATAGLWAEPQEAAEWAKVVGIARNEKTVVLNRKGSVELMYPEFGRPVSMFLDPGLETRDDVARKVEQISSASEVVLPESVRTFGEHPDAPEIAAAMRDFELEWKGDFFELYRRRAVKRDAGR